MSLPLPLLQASRPSQTVRIYDQFSATLAPGAVNGSRSSDGKSLRVVTDVEGALKTLVGRLRGGTQSTPVWGESAITWSSKPGTLRPFRRRAGRFFRATITFDDGASRATIHWTPNATHGNPLTSGHGFTNANAADTGGGSLCAITPGQRVVIDGGQAAIRSMMYLVAISLQERGAYVLISTLAADTGAGMVDPIGIPAYPQARLLHVDDQDTTTWLYPSISFYNAGGGTPYPNGHAVEAVAIGDVLSTASWREQNGLALARDFFDATVAGALGPALSGQAWTPSAGATWHELNGLAYLQAASGGYDGVTLDAGTNNGTATCTITVDAAGMSNGGMRLRQVSAGNYIRLTTLGNNALYLKKVVAGVTSDIDNAAAVYPFVAGQSYPVEVAMQDGWYQIRVRGQVILPWTRDASETHINGTRFGLEQVGTTNRLRFSRFAFYPHTVTLPDEMRQPAGLPAFAPGATLLSDVFTGTAGTRLQARAPSVGPTPTELFGQFTLDGAGRAQLASSGGSLNEVIYLLAGTTNAAISMDAIMPASFSTNRIRFGPLGRFVNTNGHFFGRCFVDLPSQGTEHEVELVRLKAGAAQIVKKSLLRNFFTPGVTYVVTIYMLGDLIVMLIDGKPRLAYIAEADDPLGANWGYYQGGGLELDSGCLADNLLVRALS